jgi:hypothetical protein
MDLNAKIGSLTGANNIASTCKPDLTDSGRPQASSPALHIQALLFERPLMWVKGTAKDIKLGDYFVHAERLILTESEGRVFSDDISSDDSGNEVGRYKGLMNNVYMRAGDAHMLVMDNHTYAAAFIASMSAKHIIPLGAKMVHIDEHDDLSPHRPDFDLKTYRLLRKAKQKHLYLIDRTDIASWQVNPLFKENIVDANTWRWHMLNQVGCSWIKFRRDGQMPVCTLKYLTDDEREIRDSHIIDIDIDVLLPLERHFSNVEKKLLAKKKIPSFVRPYINELAQSAKNARVITIATSPGYMDQDHALLYTKELVAQIQKVKNA